MSNVQPLLAQLSKVKPNGEGEWLACCPAHDDKSPSLSIREANGLILVHCFAGCDVADIMGSVGLTVGDLFDEPLERKPGAAKMGSGFAVAALRHLDDDFMFAIVLMESIRKGFNVTDEDLERMWTISHKLSLYRSMTHGQK